MVLRIFMPKHFFSEDKVKLFHIKPEYLEYLRKFDKHVPIADKGKETKIRPFVGVVFEMNGLKWCAPLSSKVYEEFDKHRETSFSIFNENVTVEKTSIVKNGVEILNKKTTTIQKTPLSSVKLSYMIPIYDEFVKPVNFSLDDIEDKRQRRYIQLMRFERNFCNAHYEELKEMAYDVQYNRRLNKNGFEHFCCDFSALEKAAKQYKKGYDRWLAKEKAKRLQERENQEANQKDLLQPADLDTSNTIQATHNVVQANLNVAQKTEKQNKQTDVLSLGLNGNENEKPVVNIREEAVKANVRTKTENEISQIKPNF